MRFINRIGQGWRDKGQRIASVSLTIVMLSAVAVAVLACFGSEVLAAWKTPGTAEQALASGGTFAELLNFEAPAQTVARLKIQTQEAERAKALAHLAVELKNWKNTDLLATLIAIFKSVPLNPPFLSYPVMLTPFTPTPPTFNPAPFNGDIHSLTAVTAYNLLYLIRLREDISGDISQFMRYDLDQLLSYAAIYVYNARLAEYYESTFNQFGINLLVRVAGIPIVGIEAATLLARLIAAGDAIIDRAFLTITRDNNFFYNQVTAIANAVFNQHLAGDVFTPLVAATPYR